jgi:hypothetical protein
MTKIQTIVSLCLLVVIIFSMDMIFGNPIRETFSNKIIVETPNKPKTKSKKNGNIIYSGSGLLNNSDSYPRGDDQPLFFGFSS